MAAARKKFKPKKGEFEPPHVYAAFAKEAFTDRTITAVRLIEARDSRGNLDLEYEES